jgi:hypothetical protein
MTFDMPVSLVHANPNVKQDSGRAALQRGPLIYCLEQADNKAGARDLALKPGAEFTPEFRPDLLGGVTILKGTALRADSTAWTNDSLYAPSPKPDEVEVTAIPYYAWDNRDPGEMVVWIPESPSLLKPPPPPDVTATATHCWSNDSVAAITDPADPKSSSDNSIARHTFWDHKGTTEWVQLDFRKPRPISSVRVYWFDDAGRGSCRVPKSWRVLAKDGDQWKPIETATTPGCEKDIYNEVRLAPVITPAIRVEVQLLGGSSGGVLRLRAQ